MTDLPEQLDDFVLADRLGRALREAWSEGKPFERGGGVSFESYGAALVPEVRRIVVDTLLHVAAELADSDGCQDVPYDLAMELDWPHTNERLTAEHAARKQARALAAWRALAGEDRR